MNRLLAVGMALGLAAFGTGQAGAKGSITDVQANNPQVQGVPRSDVSAVFPTNKQNEPTIAVNPTNALILLAGSNDEQRQPQCGPGPVRGATALANDCSFYPDVGTSGIYRSTDGGATWQNLGVLDDSPAWQASDLVSDGDPVIVWGPKPAANGSFSFAGGARAYYATLASYKTGGSPYPVGKAPELIVVSFSDDNGGTWSSPVFASTKSNPNDFNDKEAIWADRNPSSPYFGRVYVSYTEFRSAASGSEPIVVAVSTDGAASFSPPQQLSPAGNNGTGNGRQGSTVRSGPDGTVYVAWEQGSAQVIASSQDGGTKWNRPSPIGGVSDLADPIPGANFRTDSFLSLAVDQASGALYAAWATATAAGGRMVVAKSTNRGARWTPPAQVSTAGEGYAFFQGLDVAPNGRVDLGYQALTTGNAGTFGTANAAIHSYYVRSLDGGNTWSAPLRVSSAPSDPAVSAQNNLLRQFWGDYNTLVSTNGKAWFIYTDSRNGSGCAAVDAYQRDAIANGTVRGDMGDRIAVRLGQSPTALDPVTKPAPQLDCPASGFGNTDVWVSPITP